MPGMVVLALALPKKNVQLQWLQVNFHKFFKKIEKLFLLQVIFYEFDALFLQLNQNKMSLFASVVICCQTILLSPYSNQVRGQIMPTIYWCPHQVLKATFKANLTCIFLSVPKLLITFHYEICTYIYYIPCKNA